MIFILQIKVEGAKLNMRNKLYYPYINIKDEDFLKYAILYYDKLHLIVPESIRFNEKMSRVAESTDLFVKIKPEQSYQTCCDATKYTIAFIDERMRTDSNFDVYRNEHTSRLYKGKFVKNGQIMGSSANLRF